MINQGSFNLYTERKGNNKIHFKKDLVVLKKDSKSEVHRNTFGYTSFSQDLQVNYLPQPSNFPSAMLYNIKI